MNTPDADAPPRRWHIIRGACANYRSAYYGNESACRRGAKKWANKDGEMVLIMHWAPEHPQDELNGGWALVGTVKPDGPIVQMGLLIENRYEDGTMIPVTERAVTVVAPPPESDAQAWDDWAEKYIYCRTGTGHPEGDAFYDVTITVCSDPNLVGRTFAWGY